MTTHRHRFARSAFALGATAAVLAGWAPATTAATTAAATVTATSGTTTLKDVSSGVTLTCTSSSWKGSAKSGQNRIATFTGSASRFTSCAFVGGSYFTVSGSGTWTLRAVGPSSGGTQPVALSGFTLHYAERTDCSFTVSGTLNGSYRPGSATSTLTFPGTSATLTFSQVQGGLCGAVGIRNGDRGSFQATYTVRGA